MKDVGYKVGDLVINPVVNKRAVVLGFEENKVFDSVYCVKIMYFGKTKPDHILSDRIRKI